MSHLGLSEWSRLDPPHRHDGGLAFGLLTILLSTASPTMGGAVRPLEPFKATAVLADAEGYQLEVDRETLLSVGADDAVTPMLLPLPNGESVVMELKRFEVFSPGARAVHVGSADAVERGVPASRFFRGRIAGEAGSHVFLALNSEGAVNGYLTRGDGRRFVVSTSARDAGRGADAVATVRFDRGIDAPEVDEFCRVRSHGNSQRNLSAREAHRAAPLIGAPRLAHVAVDADPQFLALFGGDVPAAEDYIAQVIAAVSDIYIRDLDVRLVLDFVRTWAVPPPFGADDLGGFSDWWYAFDDPSPFNLIHLFSGRRDLPYGGIAYLADPCSGFAFGISGVMLGGFASPVESPHLGNWDVIVVAHEMGHNMGTGHTHDSYTPPIDECGSDGLWARSDIMSYCHTTMGGLLNTDLRFHARIQAVIENNVLAVGCLPGDCNLNGIDDADDIASTGSADVNGNSVPDECEDCNENGVLDSVDISSGASDVNGNGIPDGCETNCNGNALPDEHEITLGQQGDLNGNLVPDTCEPDCDTNDIVDFVEIAGNGQLDVDRDTTLDRCQDCDGNGVMDWVDMLRPRGMYVATQAGLVREYHADSGVAVRNVNPTEYADIRGMVFGSDRRAYVSVFGSDSVVRIDVETGSGAVFVASGSGGLDGPHGLKFGPNGNLFVVSQNNARVLEFQATTGAFVRTLVGSGAGGLSLPTGLVFGPSGHLFVAGGDNTVRRFDALTGAPAGVFVVANAGGLNAPREMVFTPDGRLLVTSYNSNHLLEYGPSGAFNRAFVDTPELSRPWGLSIGPNGNVFVVRTTNGPRVIEYGVDSGLYVRSFMRADGGITSPTSIAFRSESPLDCNANTVLDECDVVLGGEPDCNANLIPDACELASVGDCNENGTLDACECLVVAAPQNDGALIARNRYVSFVPPQSQCRSALRVTFTNLPAPFEALEGTHRWVSPPVQLLEGQAESFTGSTLGCTPYYADWTSVGGLFLYGHDIVPGASYTVQAIHEGCGTDEEGAYSAGMQISTSTLWADVVAAFDSAGQPDFLDISAIVSRFTGAPGAVALVRVDLYPGHVDQQVNFLDISATVAAFQGSAYPFAGPAVCP